MSSFEKDIIDLINARQRVASVVPLDLGGVPGPSGGVGGPPGGYTGYLPQRQVAYDETELATIVTPESGMSLLDNLNHIRYQIAHVSGGVGGGIEEAPVDGNLYGRKDAGWTVVPTSGTGGSGHTIEVKDTPFTSRSKLNFTGTGVTGTDHSASDTTEINILPVYIGNDPPADPENGRLWLDTDDPDLPVPELTDFSSSGASLGDIPTADGDGGITWETPEAPVSDASSITYTPADATDWNGSADPGNTNDAVDQLADRVKSLEGATSSNLVVTASPGSDHTATGVITTRTAGATLHFGDTGYIASSGKVALLNETVVTTSFGIVMCMDATINADASGNFLILGIARDDSWNWTVGQPIYGSTTGTTGNTLTQVAPSGAGNIIQILGMALSATTMMFTPQLVQIEHT
jgi:hypothetical protein